MTLWDRPSIRRTMYATSFLVLFLGLIVFVNNRDRGAAAPSGPIVPGSASQLQLDYGSPIPHTIRPPFCAILRFQVVGWQVEG